MRLLTTLCFASLLGVPLAHAEQRLHDVDGAPTLDAAFDVAVMEIQRIDELFVAVTITDDGVACEPGDEPVTCAVDDEGRLVVTFPEPMLATDPDEAPIEAPASELRWMVVTDRSWSASRLIEAREVGAPSRDGQRRVRWNLCDDDGDALPPGTYVLEVSGEATWYRWEPFREAAGNGLYGDLRTRLGVVPGSAEAEATIEVEVMVRETENGMDRVAGVRRMARRHRVRLEPAEAPAPWVRIWPMSGAASNVDVDVVVRLYIDDQLADFVIVNGFLGMAE